MDQEELNQLIDKLREELKNVDSSSAAHDEITSLIEAIEMKLEFKDVSLTENISSHIEKFEAEHPRLTNILSEIMIKLLSIGV